MVSTEIRNNIGIPAVSGFIPAGMPSFDKEKVKGFTYNPKRSAELLYIAGYPEGKGLPPITLTTTSPYQDLCEYMQHELSAIGINTNVEVIDEATYREMVAQAKLNVFKKSWVADYPDAENFLSLFYSQNFSPQGPNYTHFNNYKFDRLYERAMITNNPEERYELYRQMDQLLIDESPVIPLYYDEAVRLVQNEIQGLAGNPMNLLNLKTVKKIKQEILEE
jgi:oligopeptide transport system substrate-binding protein